MSAILSESVTLPCGLVFPNRLCKGAMAEGLAPETHVPDGKFETVYGQWGDGGWGMLLTGISSPRSLSSKCADHAQEM